MGWVSLAADKVYVSKASQIIAPGGDGVLRCGRLGDVMTANYGAWAAKKMLDMGQLKASEGLTSCIYCIECIGKDE